MSTFIICRSVYIVVNGRWLSGIAWPPTDPAKEIENEAVARHRRRRPRLLVAARIERSANGIGALRHAGRGCCRRRVLPGLFVPQSCHRDCRRDFHAVAAM